MDSIDQKALQQTLQKLRRQWAVFALASVLFLIGLYLAFAWSGIGAGKNGENSPLLWLIASSVVMAYQFSVLWRLLPLNRLSDGGPLLPSLGLANGMTITRSILNAALAGFLFVPGPIFQRSDWLTGWAAWLPGTLYLLSILLDYFDGYVARVTGQTTRLGEALDMRWDGLGMLIGSFLVVRYNQAPLPYLLVGLARYLFVFGLWLRRMQGLPTYELPDSRFRRPMAGMQMGVVAAVLFPAFTPPATHVAVLLFMLPLLAGFLRDWFAVSGQMAVDGQQQPEQNRSPLFNKAREIFPLAARGAVVILLAAVLLVPVRLPVPAAALLLVAMAVIPALLLGVAGRVVALAVLLMSGLAIQLAPLDARLWLLLLLSTVLFMTGTGRYSLWKPEEWLIDHRAGE